MKYLMTVSNGRHRLLRIIIIANEHYAFSDVGHLYWDMKNREISIWDLLLTFRVSSLHVYDRYWYLLFVHLLVSRIHCRNLYAQSILVTCIVNTVTLICLYTGHHFFFKTYEKPTKITQVGFEIVFMTCRRKSVCKLFWWMNEIDIHM